MGDGRLGFALTAPAVWVPVAEDEVEEELVRCESVEEGVGVLVLVAAAMELVIWPFARIWPFLLILIPAPSLQHSLLL